MDDQLTGLVEPYDEIIALWEDSTPASSHSRSYVDVADPELVRDIDALRHELIMQIILLDDVLS